MIKRFLTGIIMSCTITFFLIHPVMADTYVLNNVAYVSGYQPSTNFGSSAYLRVGSSYDYISYFELPYTLDSFDLHLNQYIGSTSTISIYSTTAFEEGTLTYNNRPAPTTFLTSFYWSGNGWKTISVSGGAIKYILIEAKNLPDHMFYSDDSGSQPYIDNYVNTTFTAINFNPDNEIQNTTYSSSIDYTIADDYPYPTFYLKVWKQVYYNDTWSDSVIASQHLVGYPDYCDGYQNCWLDYDFWKSIISDPWTFEFPGSQIPCSQNEKCKLTAQLINWANGSVLAEDTLIYDNEYVYEPPDTTLPEIPEPEPTPTPTYTPMPTPTFTPLPTPTLDPGLENYTINNTQSGDYYNEMNNSLSNLSSTVQGYANFMTLPIIVLTNYTNTVNDTFTDYTNQSTNHKNILLEMFIPFFSYFPWQIQLLVSYRLTLLLILLLLRE